MVSMEVNVSIEKHSKTSWYQKEVQVITNEYEEEDSYEEIKEIRATKDGLIIRDDFLFWSEIDKARESAIRGEI
jgi:hypothetical protein